MYTLAPRRTPRRRSEEDLEAERAAIEQMVRECELEHAWRTLVGECPAPPSLQSCWLQAYFTLRGVH